RMGPDRHRRRTRRTTMKTDQYPRAVTPRHTTGLEYVIVPFVVYGILVLYALRPAGEIIAWIGGDATYTGTLNLTAVGSSWTPPLSTGVVWSVAATIVTFTLIPIGILWYRLRRPRSPRAVRWATNSDLKKGGLIGPDENGRVVAGTTRGRTVSLPPTTSTLVFGPSGSGKTSAFAIPTILTWDGPAVISAVKTDLLRVTRHQRAEQGEIMVFDPFNRLEDPDRTGWDPLEHCDTYEGATTLAGNLLALSDFTTVSHGDFWAGAAEGLLGPLFLAARTDGHSLRQVRTWLNLTQWDQPKRILEGKFSEAWETLLGATENTATDTYLSYVASARVALKAYETAAALESTTLKPQVDLDQLLDTPSTLYLIGDEDDQKILRPLFVGLLDEVMRHAARRVNRGVRADRPLLFLLDDAPTPHHYRERQSTPPHAETATSNSSRCIKTGHRSPTGTGNSPKASPTTTPPSWSSPGRRTSASSTPSPNFSATKGSTPSPQGEDETDPTSPKPKLSNRSPPSTNCDESPATRRSSSTPTSDPPASDSAPTTPNAAGNTSPTTGNPLERRRVLNDATSKQHHRLREPRSDLRHRPYRDALIPGRARHHHR
ncbi:MAG: hypothetical protein GEU79_18480, partial [Acidimicrobiia bacterium]|nr:hypothetical protein [Acidimicrobiia bacterium]